MVQRRFEVILLTCLLVLASIWCAACQPARRPITDQPQVLGAELEQLHSDCDQAMILGHVDELASTAYEGRAVGTGGEQRAAAYIASQLVSWRLEPWEELGLTDFNHSFRVLKTQMRGHNVIAVRRGTTDQWLLLVAHYDHLGVKQGKLYPGADDNAAGVAILLEAARCLASVPRVPEHSVVFIFTSGEEHNLSGSKALAELLRQQGISGRCRVVNLDMMGGTGGNSLDIWREPSRPSGKKLAREVRQIIMDAGLKSNVVRRRFGAVDSRSFARAGIPSVTLSWAYRARNHPHRHRTSDTADELRAELLQKAAQGVLRVVWLLANPGQ